ncbi:MAG: T9SS type A sorting domain-containing protein [candidate division Zixibacteria bacterium]|nr:T9SS type A sorting domain-containing protein [candidate division Zixibacteria bacterium]
MKKISTLIIVLVGVYLFTFLGCSKDKGINFLPFSGITETDSTGNIISEDPNDWCYSSYESPANFEASLVGFSLPCSTLGDSCKKVITLTNTYSFDISANLSCDDTSLSFFPESCNVISMGSEDIEITYYATDDTIHGGNIIINNSSPDSIIQVYYETGAVPFWEDYGPEDNAGPPEFALYPAYPNPTSSDININFELPTGSQVKVSIYNSSGQEVLNVADGMISAGQHIYNKDLSSLSPGIYKCYLEASNFNCQGDIEVQ